MVPFGEAGSIEYSKFRTIYWTKIEERAFSFNIVLKDGCSLSCTGIKYNLYMNLWIMSQVLSTTVVNGFKTLRNELGETSIDSDTQETERF